ncbi:Chorismate synthase [uncultured archaeon]|nr:Chorismate synthase [uncultured archaeon]
MIDPFAFGEKFRIKVSGSSHGPAVGVEIDGCPAGVKVSAADIQLQLDRRKPGTSALASGRKEEDRVMVDGGIEDGITTGGKIVCSVKNKDAIASHYDKFKETPRPGHADYPSMVKYGAAEPGGGFFSGRMTLAFVIAGAIAKKLLEREGISTMAFAASIGKVSVGREVSDEEIAKNAYANAVHTAAPEIAGRMAEEVEAARDDGDSVGGIVECRITGVPAGLGEPMFASIESRISQAVFAIPAAKGIEFGSGFSGSAARGSKNNDEFAVADGKIVARTNNAGGILGGLSSGMPIVFRVAFKPTSSIFRAQKSVNVKTMKAEELKIAGRHDPCIAIRAVPVVENVAAICMADIVLGQKGGMA